MEEESFAGYRVFRTEVDEKALEKTDESSQTKEILGKAREDSCMVG